MVLTLAEITSLKYFYTDDKPECLNAVSFGAYELWGQELFARNEQMKGCPSTFLFLRAVT